MAQMMLQIRLNELGQKADAPFAVASAFYGEFIMAKTKQAFQMAMVPKGNSFNEGLKLSIVRLFVPRGEDLPLLNMRVVVQSIFLSLKRHITTVISRKTRLLQNRMYATSSTRNLYRV